MREHIFSLFFILSCWQLHSSSLSDKWMLVYPSSILHVITWWKFERLVTWSKDGVLLWLAMWFYKEGYSLLQCVLTISGCAYSVVDAGCSNTSGRRRSLERCVLDHVTPTDTIVSRGWNYLHQIDSWDSHFIGLCTVCMQSVFSMWRSPVDHMQQQSEVAFRCCGSCRWCRGLDWRAHELALNRHTLPPDGVSHCDSYWYWTMLWSK